MRFQFPKNFLSGKIADRHEYEHNKNIINDEIFNEGFDIYLNYYRKSVENYIGELKIGKYEQAMLGVGHS